MKQVINYKVTRILYLALFILIMVLSFIFTAETKSMKLARNEIGYKELIQKYFPNYILLDIDELDPLAKEVFNEHYPNLNPSLVCRDFDGNGFLDFAVLVRTSKIKDGNTVFAIFLQSEPRQFRLEFNLNMEFYRNDVFILPVEAGEILKETDAIEGPERKVKLKNPAVHLIYIGKSAVAYYWDEKAKKFDSIWTSD